LITRRKWIIGIIGLYIILLISGCGKNIPDIDPALMQSKLSVLVITKTNLPDTTKTELQKTLISWRDAHHIAYDWMPDVAELQEPQLNKIKATSYNYIIIVGNALNRQVYPLASQLQDKRWVLLDDAVSSGQLPITDKHIIWKQSGEGLMEKQWGEWVKQQQVLGKAIEWVTASSNPIPSIWAPSEEAETISLSDVEGWFTQFQTQVRQHGPDWVVIYSPLDSNTIQRIKNLRVPIMNIAATSMDLQWGAILTSLLQSIENNQWVSGIQFYNPLEIQVIKP
jgi:predicted transcriptional regulator